MASFRLDRDEWIARDVNRRDLIGQVAWFGLWLAVTIIAIGLTPDPAGHGTHQHLGLPPCPTVLLFDRPCPGCGLTTSWTAFVHGRFAEAFRAHALGPILYLAFTGTALAAIVGAVRGFRLKMESFSFNRAVTIVLVTFFAYGFVRLIAQPHYAAMHERALVRAVTGG